MEFLTMGSLAFVAGILSFTSPCCLPLMPGYLSYISTAAHDTPGPDGQSTTAGAGTTVTVARRKSAQEREHCAGSADSAAQR